MNYKVDYLCEYENFVQAISLTFDSVVVNIFLNRKYHSLDIKIFKKNKKNRKNINLSKILNEIIAFINDNTMLLKKDGSDFRQDILRLDNVKSITLDSLKLENNDITIINRFRNLRNLTTKKCTLYKNCNLGILKCDYHDYNSDIYGLDILNGFEGKILLLQKSNIKKMNKNVLHLNNIITRFIRINMDYELFFLTTDAPKMRKLEIYRSYKYPRLKDKDLLFISGFYNLESIIIDGILTNYNQIEKLERLRNIERLCCTDNIIDIEKKDKYAIIYKNEGISKSRLKNYLINRRLQIQNEHLDFLNKLYVDRLERVKWEDKIKFKDLEKIKEELIEISKMPLQERRKISKEIKQFNMFDDLFDLWFDKRNNEEEEYLVDSRPFQDDGIQYYIKRKHVHLIDE